MHEVDALPSEVIERVKLPLPGTPVELMGPVRNEAPQPVEFGALLPPYPGYLVGPSCMVQPCPQIVEHLIRDVNPKRFHYNNSFLHMTCCQLNGSFAGRIDVVRPYMLNEDIKWVVALAWPVRTVALS